MNINSFMLFSCIIIFMLISLFLGYLNIKKDMSKTNYLSINKRNFLNLIEQAVQKMDGFEFEEFVGYVFSNNGFDVVKTSKTRDGGKDLILDNKIYVELKKYKDTAVTRETVQKLIGACVSDGITCAIFITTSRYTTDTIEYFKDKKYGFVKLNLWYLDDLLTLCENLNYKQTLLYLGYSIPKINNSIKI